MTRKNLGSIAQWGSILIIVGTAMAGAVFGYGALTEKVQRLEEQIQEKVSTERFEDLKEDIKSIKESINTILRRTRRKK